MSIDKLREGEVNKVEIRKVGQHHEVFVGGERMEHLKGYKIESVADSKQFAWVTLTFLSGDISVTMRHGEEGGDAPE